MSVAIRVIPCLDVDGGRVVKGIKFEDLKDAGSPIELAQRYNNLGADELTFLDVTASSSERETVFELIRESAKELSIPLTVGGGVRTVDDVEKLLNTGADKVSINTAAVTTPGVINEISEKYGNQVLVLSLDARRNPEMESGYEVTTHGGRKCTGTDAIAWCKEAEERGVGEILLNSIDADGTNEGFDLGLIRAARAAVQVPLIASGGAGKPEHFPPAIEAGANAVLAASLFHFGPDDMISQVKEAIREAGYPVR